MRWGVDPQELYAAATVLTPRGHPAPGAGGLGRGGRRLLGALPGVACADVADEWLTEVQERLQQWFAALDAHAVLLDRGAAAAYSGVERAVGAGAQVLTMPVRP